jgi:hypothetical protein
MRTASYASIADARRSDERTVQRTVRLEDLPSAALGPDGKPREALPPFGKRLNGFSSGKSCSVDQNLELS